MTTKKMLIDPRYRLRVMQRLAIVQYAECHGVKPASGRFALDRKTIGAWRDRFRADGVGGLTPRYPAKKKTRVPEDVVRLLEHTRRCWWGGQRIAICATGLRRRPRHPWWTLAVAASSRRQHCSSSAGWS